jgi:L-iditol 2-dehydrogenase
LNNQTAYLTRKEYFEIKDTPMPACDNDDVLIEIKHMGICGSDVMFYTDPTVGGRFQPNLPIVLGHECAGQIVKIGKDVKTLSVGDRVALEPGIPCCKCKFCLSGRYNLCPNVDFMAAPPFSSGALNKYIAHPAAFTFKLPENVSTVEGAMIEPLAVGMHAANRAQVQPEDSVVILGAGCIGLMTLLACRNRGVTNITVVDLFENRLQKAMELGAQSVVNGHEQDIIQTLLQRTNGEGLDIVFETAGSTQTARQTPSLVKTGGKVVMVGNVHGETAYDFLTMNGKEADILSVFRYRNIFPSAIDAVRTGSIPVKGIASDFFTFKEVNEAFSCALHQKQTALKVILEF